ncbi:MAG TPA: hypothetical protein VMW34_18795 [Anaerolineales bacterium]|nr:hypothetical protein [Anaerolineales bacterium]
MSKVRSHREKPRDWRRNMVVRDEGTGTLWQHTTGKAAAGPLKAQQLEILNGALLPQSAWKAQHS